MRTRFRLLRMMLGTKASMWQLSNIRLFEVSISRSHPSGLPLYEVVMVSQL